jgi:hypothetical protein
VANALAAGRSNTRIARIFTPAVVAQLQAIETDLGGRQELVGTLMLAHLTKDLQYLLGLLGDPLNQSQSLAAICAQGNVLPGDLLTHLQGAIMRRGKLLASRHIGLGMAAVAEDVMRKAAPYEAACTTCLGTGSITPDPTAAVPNPTHHPCGTCNGNGKLLYQPDLDTQRLALEMADLLKKGGGINIAMQQNNLPPAGGGAGGGSLEDFQDVTDKILYGQGSGQPPVVDAEVADPDTTPPTDV